MCNRRLTYSNFANLNPYSDERYTLIEDFYGADDQEQDSIDRAEKHGDKPGGTSHWQSEGFHNAQHSKENSNDDPREYGQKFHGRSHSQSGDARNAQVSSHDAPHLEKAYGHKGLGLSLPQIQNAHNTQSTEECSSDQAKRYGHKSPGMAHSQSERNIDFRACARDDHSIKVGKKFGPRDSQNRESDDSTANTASPYSRGRRLT